MANTYIFRGDAVAVSQADLITVTGVWAAADTVTMTINGKDLIVTIGTAVTVTDVALAIVAAWNGAALVGDESRNTTGDLIPEFNESTATSAVGVVTLTADPAGVPFIVTVVENTAGTGTAVGTTAPAAGTTASNGPNHWTKENFFKETAGVRIPSDDLPGTLANASVFVENTSVSILYDLDQSAVAQPWDDLNIPSSFTGAIGLPKTNGGGYEEYRERYLKPPDQVGNTDVKIGEGEGAGSGRVLLDFLTSQSSIAVSGSSSGVEEDLKAIILKGTHASNTLEITSGEVDVAPDKDDISVIATLRVVGDGIFRASGGVDISTLATFEDSTEGVFAPAVANVLAALVMTGGPTVTVGGDGAITTVDLLGGTLDYQGAGTITTLNGGPDATADFAGNPNASVTITTLNVEARFSLNDPDKKVTFTNPINQGNIGENDWQHEFGKGRTIHPEG